MISVLIYLCLNKSKDMCWCRNGFMGEIQIYSYINENSNRFKIFGNIYKSIKRRYIKSIQLNAVKIIRIK